METRETILLQMILDELKKANLLNETLKTEMVRLETIITKWDKGGVPSYDV